MTMLLRYHAVLLTVSFHVTSPYNIYTFSSKTSNENTQIRQLEIIILI